MALEPGWKNFVRHVDEVSGRIEFFQRTFAHSPVSKQFIGVSYTTWRAPFNATTRFLIT